MKINTFKFTNQNQDWKIEEINFGNINLLVGGSGVGKTTILRSIDLVVGVAQGEKRKLDGIEWSIDFSHDEKNYQWELKSSSFDEKNSFSELTEEESEIVYEKLTEYSTDTKIEIFHRSPSTSILNNKNLPKLKRSESAINLLSEEEKIVPVVEAFKRFSYNKVLPESLVIDTNIDPLQMSLKPELQENFENFKYTVVELPVILKAFLLQMHFPTLFDSIKEIFTDIFPDVLDIRVRSEEDRNRYKLLCEIQNKTSKNWILQSQISSGMLRTLYFFFETFLAPKGYVILIDEFENSLGINCMPQMADLILDYESSIQFILTSHHPYIINNIPWETWQVVSRKSNLIKTTKASDIPELNSASSLDKFTQLINFWQYQELVS